jgi:hypothetical protein
VIQEKIISQLLDPNRGISSVLESQISDKGSVDKYNGSFNKISGAFQIGGIPGKDGRYLVGENGPEIVKLPKGSAVIPLNISDLIDGLKKFPELSDYIKGEDLELFADPNNPSVLMDGRGKISLNELQRKYDDMSKEQGDSGILDKRISDQLSEQVDLLKDLKSLAQKKIADSIKTIETERDRVLKDYGEDDAESYRSLASKLIDAIPKNYINPLTSAKMDLIAAKSISAGKELKSKNKGEEIVSGKNLGEIKKLGGEKILKQLSKEDPEIYRRVTEIVNSNLDSSIKGGRPNEEKSGISDVLNIANDLIRSIRKNPTFASGETQEKFLNNVEKYESTKPQLDIIKSSPEILGSFMTGGLATSSGNYLVGENGPELIKNVLDPSSYLSGDPSYFSKISKSPSSLSSIQGNPLSFIENQISANALKSELNPALSNQPSASLNNFSSYLTNPTPSDMSKGVYNSGSSIDSQIYPSATVLKNEENPSTQPAVLKNTVTPLTETKRETKPSVNESIDKLKTDLVDVFKKKSENEMSPTVSQESDKSQTPMGSATATSESPAQQGPPGKNELSKDLQNDLADIKSLLGRISSLLEGPLEFSAIESPFRPDSRKV